jgi:transcriptional regulator with PAS, ATPase and Fis domain
VVEIALPPLRDRQEDILELANFFLQKYATENGREIEGFSADAEEGLLRFAWPGNVRELGNVMERAVVLLPREESVVALKHLSKNIQSSLAA